MKNKHFLTQYIKAEAKRLGFDVCGITHAEPVAGKICKGYRKWLADGNGADMDYLSKNIEKRLDPTLLVEDVKSIVCVAMNYRPSTFLPKDGYQLAWYAYGKDYHIVMKEHLQQLFLSIKSQDSAIEGRYFCDTAPVLERYWAERAGLGWRGKNTQLIIPKQGTSFFLGELFLNIELEYDKPMDNHCGNCNACLEQCPTHALYTDEETGLHLLNAKLCLSYQTIENKNDISPIIQKAMGLNIYGCDKCQKACPHNKFAQPTSHKEFAASEELLQMTQKDWDSLTIEKYRTLFKNSAVKRAKFEGLVRNIKATKRNT